MSYLPNFDDVAGFLYQGFSDKQIMEECSITRYRLLQVKAVLWENEVRALKKDLEDERAEASKLRRQVEQYRDLHNKTRGDLVKLGEAATVLLHHPMMEALRLFAEDAKPDKQPRA